MKRPPSARDFCHQIEVSLSWGPIPPDPGSVALGEARGGRETLLVWLETQLGLLHPAIPHSTRVVRYAARLQETPRPTYRQSLSADLWGTAKSLLGRRDELRLLGWTGNDAKNLPALVRDLSYLEHGGEGLPPGEPERLAAISAALTNGQVLPSHEVILREPADAWPKSWRPVLDRLTVRVLGEKLAPAAPAKSALRAVQEGLADGDIQAVKADKSLVWWRALGTVTAAEAVASSLATLGSKAGRTVVLCEDPSVAEVLDDALVARGLPSIGAVSATQAHPVLQVLPLSLGLLWEPADPERVLDFLMLPVGPISKTWARALADALAERPGIGGPVWNAAVEALAAQAPEKAAESTQRLRAWLLSPQARRGQPLTQEAVAQRCSQVAQWALGRAATASRDAGGLEEALAVLASQAGALAALAKAYPQPITEAQLQRLIASVQEGGTFARERAAAAGGARWIRSLAELQEPCDRLIWFGVHSENTPAVSWSAEEARQLLDAGIDVDFEPRRHALKRDAERAGLMRVAHTLLAIELAGAAATPDHPVWLAAKAALGRQKPVLLEELIAEGRVEGPWPLLSEARTILRPRPHPPVWRVDPKLLSDRDTTSAAELETRLGCPLKWTFEYAADLRASPIAELPSGFLLRGNLSHDVLEEVFSDPRPKSAEAASRKATQAFDRRVATEAAALAKPHAAGPRLALRGQIETAARAFFDVLKRGRYEVVGFELTPKAELFSRRFTGRLDCVLAGADGSSALLDLKYAGRKYRDLLEEGAAIQLCVYVAALAQDRTKGKTRDVAAGYFIVDRARLWTPKTGGLAGTRNDESLPDAPHLADVWDRFAAALKAAEGWLASGEIPARPLQEPGTWPEGAALALRPVKKTMYSGFEGLSLCQYCAYPRLCGLEPVE